MNILEKDIEELIFNASKESLQKRKLFLYDNRIRQLNLLDYGIADIVCWHIGMSAPHYRRKIYIQILELKKEIIDASTLMQSCRYEKGIRKMLKKYNLSKTDLKFNHILIGKKVQTNGDFVFLLDAMENCKVMTYNLDLDSGLTFNECSNYSIINGRTPDNLEFEVLYDLRNNIRDNMKTLEEYEAEEKLTTSNT